jgi:hypothetical protein
MAGVQLICLEEIDFKDPIAQGLNGAVSNRTRTGIRTLSNDYPARSRFTFRDGPLNNVWASAYGYWPNAGGNRYQIFGLGQSSKGHACIVATIENNGKVRLETFNGVSTWATLGTSANYPCAGGGTFKLDLEVLNFAGGSPALRLYVSGSPFFSIEFTGDATIGGTLTALDQIMLFGRSDYNSGVSGIFVHTADTRPKSPVIYYPSNTGDQNQWSGVFGNVAEQNNDDTTLVTVNANDQEVNFALTDPPAGAFKYEGVWITHRSVRTAGSTPTKIAAGLRLSGVSDLEAGQTVQVYWDSFYRWMETINGGAFDATKLTNMQLAMKSAA